MCRLVTRTRKQENFSEMGAMTSLKENFDYHRFEGNSCLLPLFWVLFDAVKLFELSFSVFAFTHSIPRYANNFYSRPFSLPLFPRFICHAPKPRDTMYRWYKCAVAGYIQSISKLIKQSNKNYQFYGGNSSVLNSYRLSAEHFIRRLSIVPL